MFKFKIFQDKIWLPFIINISLTMVLIVLGIFIGLLYRNRQLIHQVIFEQAKAHFNTIVKTRLWNSDHGGVYVEKKDGVKSNPYLKNPDIKTTDGRIFTLRNPAIMTREISEYFNRDGGLSLHITSLKLLNPANKPDEFETDSLKRFEKGEKETSLISYEKEKSYFRYMAPLIVDETCLKCHDTFNYKTGDVRGGISLKMDITGVENNLKLNRTIIILLSVITILTILFVFYSSVSKLFRELNAANEKIQTLSRTDDLTNLYNRRFFFDKMHEEIQRAFRYKHSVSCIIMDLDHFKKINDTFGHLAGDSILRDVASIIRENCRKFDAAARFGGEELIIILPQTDLNNSVLVAEKIRGMVENHKTLIDGGKEIGVTISLGAAAITPHCNDVETIGIELIKKADMALYNAKENGRNRVEY